MRASDVLLPETVRKYDCYLLSPVHKESRISFRTMSLSKDEELAELT